MICELQNFVVHTLRIHEYMKFGRFDRFVYLRCSASDDRVTMNLFGRIVTDKEQRLGERGGSSVEKLLRNA